MTETQRHNGWTNYETWAVALWIDNDQGSHEYWREVCQQALDDTDADDELEARRDQAVDTVAKQLKDEIEEGNPLADQNGLYSDLLSAAISETNWYEIARNWIGDLEPTTDA